MHPLLARIPLVRRPFYQLEVARQERNRAVLERDAAIRERDELKLRLQDVDTGAPAPRLSPPGFCVFCNGAVDAWVPFRIKVSDLSPFTVRVGTVGSNVERFACPHCWSTDRERHLRLFLDRLGVVDPLRGGSALHMAPEPRLQEYLQSYDWSLYVKGDLCPSDESVQKIDLHQIPFPAESFDLVVCNHVLEHVDGAEGALRELRRVLKPGGRAICQTPFASRLTHGLEDPLLQSTDDRLFFYGQEDHVRLFGADIEQIFQAAGFSGRLVPHSEILPDVDPERLGINEREPFFDFVRSPSV